MAPRKRTTKSKTLKTLQKKEVSNKKSKRTKTKSPKKICARKKKSSDSVTVISTIGSKEKIIRFNAELEKYKISMKRSALMSTKLLAPLELLNHNGTGTWSFSCATIDYSPELNGYPCCFWFQSAVLMVLSEMVNKNKMNDAQKESFNELLDYVYNIDEHRKCLESLRVGDKKEAEVMAVLALHLFTPLLPKSQYKVDFNASKQRLFCPVCNKSVKTGDTLFGCVGGWHGNADIVLEHSIVNVESDEKFDSEDDMETEEDALDGGDLLFDRQNFSCSLVEDKLERAFKKWQAYSQVLAQTIVNAFCAVKSDPSLWKSFIPSFLATEKHVTIHMYNCERDALLFSEKLKIWSTTDRNSLDISTICYIWMAMNFNKFEMDTEFDIFKSNFKKIAGAHYHLYLDDVSRPLKKTREKSDLNFQLCSYFMPGRTMQKLMELENEVNNAFASKTQKKKK